MNIIVCVKQVPENRNIRIDPKTGRLIREGISGVINPQDKTALEEALRLRQLHGGSVTVITMGPPQADSALREALAMGADKAYLLCDRAFGGADTAATSYTLCRAIEKLGTYELILCGTEATDGCTAQVGPEMAEMLDIPQISYACEITAQNGKIRARRTLDGVEEEVEASLPALVTVVKQLNEVRLVPLSGVVDAYQEGVVTVWNANDIAGDSTKVGGPGSRTQTRKLEKVKSTRSVVTMLSGSVDEIARQLVSEFDKLDLL